MDTCAANRKVVDGYRGVEGSKVRRLAKSKYCKAEKNFLSRGYFVARKKRSNYWRKFWPNLAHKLHRTCFWLPLRVSPNLYSIAYSLENRRYNVKLLNMWISRSYLRESLSFGAALTFWVLPCRCNLNLNRLSLLIRQNNSVRSRDFVDFCAKISAYFFETSRTQCISLSFGAVLTFWM